MVVGAADSEEEEKRRQEHRQSGHHADRHCKLQPDDAQTRCINRAQRDHHENLAMQECAQNLIGFPRQGKDGAALSGRNNCREFLQDCIPITQQIESQDWNEKQTDHGSGERTA